MTATFETTSRRALAPRLFKASAASVFALGSLIHTGRMLVGLEEWTRDYFTPPVDIAFGAVIIVPAITGLMAWKRYSGGWGGRLLYTFAMLLVLVSVPLHLRTALTWSTEYLNAFPFWYSAIEVPMFLVLAFGMTRLKFDERV
jgi:hypothetical protein